MTLRVSTVALLILLGALPVRAQVPDNAAIFRSGNEKASLSRWDEAIEAYAKLDEEGVRAPALYWNWAQAAGASGLKGEALWALLNAQEQAPRDASIKREMERLRGELGLDPSEMSLGFLGELRALARRFRFDAVAIALMIASLAAVSRRKPRVALACFLVGLVMVSPFFAAPWREPRAVVIRKDAPLVDAPSLDAVALATLREGEVVPVLEQEGDYFRIQDASGARGFAHNRDVRRIGVN